MTRSDESWELTNVLKPAIAPVSLPDLPLVVLSALGSIFTRTRIRIMHRAGRGAIAHLREDLFKHIQGLSFSFFDSRSAGKIMVRVINDVNSLIDLFTNGIVQVLVDCFNIVIILILLLVVNAKITFVAMSVLPFILFLMFKLRRWIPTTGSACA